MDGQELALPNSVQEVSMGTVVSQFPIEKYRVSENSVDLMTILTKDPIVTKTMYHDKVGFRFHELPAALKLGLQASTHYNFLAALWNGSKDGSMIIDNRYTVVLLSLPKKVYERLVKKYQLNGDLRQLVLQVYLDGEVKYQVMNFEVDNTKKPPYMTDKALFERIKQDVTEFKKYIPFVVGSPIDEQRFMELWNAEGTATEQYNPQQDQQFRNRGVVGQGGGQATQLPPNTMEATVVNQGQGQISQGAQGGTLKQEDFNFDDAGQGGSGNQGNVQQGNVQQGNVQQQNTQQQNTQQNTQQASDANVVQEQKQPANDAAAKANAVGQQSQQVDNAGDFNFES
jgi:hypothetical protein